ncbi:hypothetical protein D3C77_432090 [compost metagenome]
MCRPQLDLLRVIRAKGQQKHHQEQHETADDLHCPYGVEKHRIIAALTLDNVLPQARVREQLQDDSHGGCDSHDAEHFGHQQAGDNQVAAQTYDLGRKHRPDIQYACPYGPLA